MLSGDTQRYELVKTKLLSDTFSLKGVLAVHLSNRQYILIKILRVLDTIRNRFINICVLSTLLKSYFSKNLNLPSISSGYLILHNFIFFSLYSKDSPSPINDTYTTSLWVIFILHLTKIVECYCNAG